MSRRKKEILICCTVGLVIAIAVLAAEWSKDVSVVHKLLDAFFVAGVMLTGVGGLKFCRNKGAFDMMSFSLLSVFYLTFPAAKANKPPERQNEEFYDYTVRKKEERKSAFELLVSGALYLGISLLLLVVYLLTEN